MNKISDEINNKLYISNNNNLYVVDYYNNVMPNYNNETIGIFNDIDEAFICVLNNLIYKVNIADPNANGFKVTEWKSNTINTGKRWVLDYRKLCCDIPPEVIFDEVTTDGRKRKIKLLNDDYLRYCLDDEISNKIKNNAIRLRDNNENINDYFKVELFDINNIFNEW